MSEFFLLSSPLLVFLLCVSFHFGNPSFNCICDVISGICWAHKLNFYRSPQKWMRCVAKATFKIHANKKEKQREQSLLPSFVPLVSFRFGLVFVYSVMISFLLFFLLFSTSILSIPFSCVCSFVRFIFHFVGVCGGKSVVSPRLKCRFIKTTTTIKRIILALLALIWGKTA